MGMFDSVYLEEGVECPCGKRIHDFQSKDFDCLLETFIVDKEGIISAEDYKLVEVPKEEQNELGLPWMKKVLLGFYTLDITDRINIYTPCPHGKYWIDIDLLFINGKVADKQIRISEME